MNPQCALSLTYQASLISFPLKYYIAQGLEMSFPIYNLSQSGLTLLYFAHITPPVPFSSSQRYKVGFWNSGAQVAPAFPSELSVSFTYTTASQLCKNKFKKPRSLKHLQFPSIALYFTKPEQIGLLFYILVIVH